YVTVRWKAAVEAQCPLTGMATGPGLASTFRTKFPRSLLAIVAGPLFVANTINIGADLAGMADAMELLTAITSHFWVVSFAAFITWATIRLRYAVLANVLKWLALFLFAYVVTAIRLHPDWSAVLRASVIPAIPNTRTAWSTLVAILGTTISPYLFFWQASQEVEEEKVQGRTTTIARRGATDLEIIMRRIDVITGAFFSNAVMFFIIITTAVTLHSNGIRHIETTRQAAEALRPLAGSGCFLLFTAGIMGTGLLAIPTLAGSAAYALAETFGWKQGLDEKVEKARAFYAVVLLSIAMGIGIDFAHINPVRAMYWSAVINGLLAPFLLVGILMVSRDREIMHN